MKNKSHNKTQRAVGVGSSALLGDAKRLQTQKMSRSEIMKVFRVPRSVLSVVGDNLGIEQ
jgi:hypothetical protein